MGCSACSGNKTITEHRVVWPRTGVVKVYASEVEARSAAAHDGGVYEQVRR